MNFRDFGKYQIPKHKHHVYLIWIIEECCGFVEQYDGCLLCNSFGNHSFLPFSIAECLECLLSYLFDTDTLYALSDNFVIVLGEAAPETRIGATSETYYFVGGEVFDSSSLL